MVGLLPWSCCGVVARLHHGIANGTLLKILQPLLHGTSVVALLKGIALYVIGIMHGVHALLGILDLKPVILYDSHNLLLL